MPDNPKQLARIGEFYLEEAVLNVLLRAQQTRTCLGPSDISKQAGIYRGSGKKERTSMQGAIAQGMLYKLEEQGRIEQCKQVNGRNGWQLTNTEFEVRSAAEV